MSEDVRPKRWKRWLKRALLAFLVLLIVALILHQVWNYRAGKALQRELDLIRAAGDPLTLDELWPPEIEPKSENAAYLYQAAFNLLVACGFEEAESALPVEVMLSSARPRSGEVTEPASWTEEQVGAVRRLVEQCREPIDLARRAARMERSRFDPGFYFPVVPDVKRFNRIRWLSWLMGYQAFLTLHDGDFTGALEDCRTALRISQALAEEPLALSVIMRLSLLRISLHALEIVLSDGQPSGEVSRALLEDLERAQKTLRPQLATGWKGERVLLMVGLGLLKGEYDRLAAATREAAEFVPRSLLTNFLYSPLATSWEVAYLRQMRTRILPMLEADYPHAQPTMGTLRAETEVWEEHPVRHLPRLVLGRSMPAILKSKEDVTELETRLTLARTALVLKHYKAEHGAYPETLDPLVPGLLDELPRDPFSGGQLVYRREGEGLLLYSVGLNQTDEGGIDNPYVTFSLKDPVPRRLEDDIAWRCAQ